MAYTEEEKKYSLLDFRVFLLFYNLYGDTTEQYKLLDQDLTEENLDMIKKQNSEINIDELLK